MYYLEYKDWKSNKFWEINIKDAVTIVTYGKIGSVGQSKTKEYKSTEDAKKNRDKQYLKKLDKDYFPALPASFEKEFPNEIIKLWVQQIQDYEAFLFKAYEYDDEDIEECKTDIQFNKNPNLDFETVEKQGFPIPAEIQKTIADMGILRIEVCDNCAFKFYDSQEILKGKADIDNRYLLDWKESLTKDNIADKSHFEEQVLCLEKSIPVCFLPEIGGEAYIMLSYHKKGKIIVSQLTHDEGIHELGEYSSFFNFIKILNEVLMEEFDFRMN